ncbi:MAG: putative inorganic carbon transporter subunit DabA, partial [Alcanivorax sp.]
MSTQALADQVHDDGLEADIEAAIQTTVSRIAPTWPLDRMIAVNPYWGHRDLSFMQTATQLARLAGSPMALDASDYRDAWQAGDIDADALAQARDELAPGESVEALLDALETPAAPLTPAPLLSDTLDKH